jgi:regulator of replication initiation timing
MEPVHPVWVGVLMTIMTGLGALLPKITDWFSNKNKADREKKLQDQADIDFIIKNYRQLSADQIEKGNKLESKLLEVQQRILDMQTAHIATLTENVSMKQQIQTLTAELQTLTTENKALRLQLEELERRIPK